MHSMTLESSPMTTIKKANEDFKHVNLIIGNSKSLQMSLKNRFPAHKGGEIKFVHLGVDTAKFIPRKNPASKPFHLLFAGRLIPRKGVPTLLKAVQLARRSIPSLISVTGKPTYKAYLKQKARNLKTPVQFKGTLSRKQMPGFYRSGNCFVCPSQKHEAFGLVNVEVMASGLPVIASKNGGIPEIVQHGRNGLLVQKNQQPSAFAHQIVKLAKDSQLHACLSRQAREDALNRFSWRLTPRELIVIYKDSIK